MHKFNVWKPLKGYLPALSIQQPYSWLIVHGVKNIENRDWTTAYRGPLVIHTGLQLDRSAYFEKDEVFSAYPQELADLSFLEKMPRRSDFKRGVNLGGIVGIAELVDVVTFHSFLQRLDPWFVGRYGFVLRNIKPVKFRECKGQLGLFPVLESLIEIDTSEPVYQRSVRTGVEQAALFD